MDGADDMLHPEATDEIMEHSDEKEAGVATGSADADALEKNSTLTTAVNPFSNPFGSSIFSKKSFPSQDASESTKPSSIPLFGSSTSGIPVFGQSKGTAFQPKPLSGGVTENANQPKLFGQLGLQPGKSIFAKTPTGTGTETAVGFSAPTPSPTAAALFGSVSSGPFTNSIASLERANQPFSTTDQVTVAVGSTEEMSADVTEPDNANVISSESKVSSRVVYFECCIVMKYYIIY